MDNKRKDIKEIAERLNGACIGAAMAVEQLGRAFNNMGINNDCSYSVWIRRMWNKLIRNK